MSDPGYPFAQSASIYCYSAWYRNSDGGLASELSQSYAYESHGEDKVSVRTPGWPHVVQENPYYRGGWKVRYTPSNWHGAAHDGSISGSGTLPVNLYQFVPSELQSNISSALDRCKARCITKLLDGMKEQKFNAGVALAEARQTANLVTSTTRKIAQAVQSLRKGNVGGALRGLTGTSSRERESRVRRAGTVPRQWLELQYGWKPLLSDVYGATEALKNRLNERPAWMNVRAAASEQCNDTVRFSGDYGLPSEWTQDASAHCYGFVEYEMGNEQAHAQSSTGVQNPLSVIWEKVPWSFVVDWFLPVGNYLNNLDAASGLVFRRGYLSLVHTNKVTSKLTDGKYEDGAVTMNHSGASRSEEGKAFVREVLGSFPTSPPPSLRNPLSLNHVANGLSLLATAFGR